MASVKQKDESWISIIKAFPITDPLTEIHPVSEEELNTAINLLEEYGVARIIINIMLDNIWEYLRKNVTPQFWEHFIVFSKEIDLNEDKSTPNNFMVLLSAVRELYMNVKQLMVLVERCSKAVEITGVKICDQLLPTNGMSGLLKIHLSASLLSQLPSCFPVLIQRVYQQAFKIFSREVDLQDDPDCTNESVACVGCGGNHIFDQMEDSTCECSSIMEVFSTINSHLRDLDLVERHCGATISDILMGAICEKVDKVCGDSYDQQWINKLDKWLDIVVVGWLDLVNGGSKANSSYDSKLVEQAINVIYRPGLYQKYTSTRINQLFNIVIEYPESQPVLEDLRECLDKTDLRDVLVTSLKDGIQTRMLHPGVNTLDILNAYISLIKALRILDPKGILLELVSEPIRQYLRGRSDFVRYIVTSLTDDDGSELSDELLVSAPLVLDDSYSEVDDMENWEQWTPDPMHAQASIKRKSQRTADIISMLVNIYGSRNVFIIEYQTILADRILTHFNYDTEQEIRYLELLKVRFGENLAQLLRCEVMVKDIGDSKRINSSIQSEQNPHFKKHSFPVSCLIVSGQFWPQFKDDSLKLPEKVTNEFEIYKEAYQDLKGNRTLVWKPHLGQVHLEVSIGNQTLDMTVSPVEATIILLFENQSKWVLDDLSREMQIPKAALRRKVAFWQAQGVIQESTLDTFVLCEGNMESDESLSECAEMGPPSSVPSVSAPPPREILDEESESVMASPHEQRQEEMQVLWSYIVGMLTNHDALPLDRIHSMLKLFVQDAVECSQDELRMFLEAKIREHLIVYSNCVYKLAKN